MRIIAGEFRGRPILPPSGDATRPITDRAKQSLFDVLAPQIPGERVYDCFAGTGSMGLECLSRGAAEATFFDADRSALTLLKKNIEAMKVTERSKVVAGDIFRWASKAALPTPAVGLIFLDPPYRFLRERPVELQTLARQLASHLTADGSVVFRHDTADALELPGLARYDLREYGSMTIELLRSANDSVTPG